MRYALAVALASVSASPSSLAGQPGKDGQSMGTAITITIGDRVFAARLAENATAAAFEKLAPLSITMSDLNGNEKFAQRCPHKDVALPEVKRGAPVYLAL